MTDKPTALRLADALELDPLLIGEEAAAELRRLHAENEALLNALRRIAYLQPDIGSPPLMSEAEAVRVQARAAIARAEGKQ